jgi:hypothetical protein
VIGGGLLAVGLLAACASAPTRAEGAGPQSLRELEARVQTAWAGVQRYRTVERLERLTPEGRWEPLAPPLATDYVLPDRKYQRPAEPTDPALPAFLVVGPTVYQREGARWEPIDPARLPADSPLAHGFQQLRTAGLEGSPFRVPPGVEGRLTPAGSEVLDGRLCRWFQGTAQGPAGPVLLRVALEEGRDLPCSSEAEFTAPYGRARQAIRYFDYNAAIELPAPPAS